MKIGVFVRIRSSLAGFYAGTRLRLSACRFEYRCGRTASLRNVFDSVGM